MRIFQLTAFTALLSSSAVMAAQSNAERVFENARDWTVYVRTSISRPFIEDNQGSFSGSGLLVDSERGWILTNAHVASRSYSDTTIEFRGGKPLHTTPVYVDPYLDIAVIAYDPRALELRPQEPKLQCVGSPAVGHPVGAFGHPWGFRFTGTRGITSAMTSRLGPDMLQTDAPINGGNSGGPLISLETGRVLGINTSGIEKSKAEGLNFAVPMPLICTLLNQLRAGIDPSPPAHLVSFAINESRERTLVVASSRLPAGSPDLRAGDEIVEVGTQRTAVRTQAQLIDRLRGTLGNVNMRITRNGESVLLHGSWPAAPLITKRRALWIGGAMFSEADAQSTSLIAASPSLMVHHVEPGSEAEGLQFSAFDLLESVDGKGVRSLEDLESIAKNAAQADKELNFQLLRFSDDSSQELFSHEVRSLSAADIEWVGPTDSRAARATATIKSSGRRITTQMTVWQRIILILAALAITTTGLYAPFQWAGAENEFVGYGWLWNPPDGDDDTLAVTILLAEWLGILIVTALAWLAASPRKS